MLKQLDKFHKTGWGYLSFGIAELGLAYLFASLAVDHGVIGEYLLAIILLLGFVQNFFKLIRKFCS